MKTLKISLVLFSFLFVTANVVSARQGVLEKAKAKAKAKADAKDKTKATTPTLTKGKKGGDDTKGMAVKGQGVPENPSGNKATSVGK